MNLLVTLLWHLYAFSLRATCSGIHKLLYSFWMTIEQLSIVLVLVLMTLNLHIHVIHLHPNKCLTFQGNVPCPFLMLSCFRDILKLPFWVCLAHQMFPEPTVFLTHSPPQWLKAREGHREGICHSLSVKPSTERYLESNWWSLVCVPLCYGAEQDTQQLGFTSAAETQRHSSEQHTQKHTLYKHSFLSCSPLFLFKSSVSSQAGVLLFFAWWTASN